jgi:hypothetical protein
VAPELNGPRRLRLHTNNTTAIASSVTPTDKPTDRPMVADPVVLNAPEDATSEFPSLESTPTGTEVGVVDGTMTTCDSEAEAVADAPKDVEAVDDTETDAEMLEESEEPMDMLSEGVGDDVAVSDGDRDTVTVTEPD